MIAAARASKIAFLASKAFGLSVKMYFPAARIQLSEIKVYEVSHNLELMV